MQNKHRVSRRCIATLETTQGQIDGFFSQLPFKCYLPEVASVGDWLEICPKVASRVVAEVMGCRGGVGADGAAVERT